MHVYKLYNLRADRTWNNGYNDEPARRCSPLTRMNAGRELIRGKKRRGTKEGSKRVKWKPALPTLRFNICSRYAAPNLGRVPLDRFCYHPPFIHWPKKYAPLSSRRRCIDSSISGLRGSRSD